MIELIEHEDILEIQLARAPVNAFNGELTLALNEAVINAQSRYRALVISGRSGMFSAGLDVPELMTFDAEGMRAFWRAYFGLLGTLAQSSIPTVAALTGHAPAGGAVASLYCDYRIMTQGQFVIGLNETQVGLVVPRVIQQALIRLVGEHRAERLIVAGMLVDPDQALNYGLIDELVETPEAVVTRAVAWCNELLALPPHAMLMNRQMMRQDLVALFDELGEQQIEQFVEGWYRDDTQAVLKGLLERLGSKK